MTDCFGVSFTWPMDASTHCKTLDLAEKDPRDVIWGAEYDGTEVRKRDFSQPFK